MAARRVNQACGAVDRAARKRENTMLFRRNRNSIEETDCPGCNLLTPARRGECVHCGLPIGPGDGLRKEPGTDRSSLEQHWGEKVC